MRLWYFSSSVNSFFKRACAVIQWGAGSPELSLVAYVLRTIILWAGSNVCGSMTHFSWSSNFVLNLEDYSIFGDFDSLLTYFCLQWFVEVWYENVCECSKVRNWPVDYSRSEAGTSVYFGHISSSFGYTWFIWNMTYIFARTYFHFISASAWWVELNRDCCSHNNNPAA